MTQVSESQKGLRAFWFLSWSLGVLPLVGPCLGTGWDVAHFPLAATQTEEHWTWSWKAYIQVPGLPRTSCVIWDAVLDYSGLTCPIKNMTRVILPQGWCEDWV